MQYHLDKTVVLVAATKALKDVKLESCWDSDIIQGVVDMLTHKKANFIQSVTLDDVELELLYPYIEDV